MAVAKAALNQVELGSAPLNRFQPLLEGEQWTELEHTMADLRDRVAGRVVWNVNSTARGGGVAELLASLIPYDRGAGIDERWAVIEGSPDFFDVTKKIHTLLHGVTNDGSEIDSKERRQYEETMERNAAALTRLIGTDDVAILHDPQTGGLIPALVAQGTRVIWRSHVGVDQPNDAVRNAWAFLMPYLSGASAFVFSRRAYVWQGLDEDRVRIIAPCIDPFSTKNRDMSDADIESIASATGLPRDAPIVLQVSRWDRLKDPAGVMQAFASHVAPQTDAWLVLAGPAATGVTDDPEQPEILADLSQRLAELAEAIRRRIVIAQLPMEDIEVNARMVNALQRRADVAVQKSLAEGFGLTVAEAMWKSRPVVASRVGGIEDQIENGRSGILIDDPRDLPAFGQAVVDLLRDKPNAEALGHEARLRVTRHFLAPRYLMEQAMLIQQVLARA
jgi:trehalose synthase